MSKDTKNPEWPRYGKFAITGASGMLGTALTHRLRGQEHDVVPVTRSPDKEGIYWKPSAGEIQGDALEGFDAVIHLAGENIFGRWTEAKKRRIRESREQGTRLLAETLAGLEDPPRVFLSASGVDYYGARGDEWVDESDPPGDSFLAEVCQAWEQACDPAREAGIRTVNMRTGVVLTGEGGALEMMLTPFKFGVGGRVGSGEQYMSWIGLEDYQRAVEFLAFQTDIDGPVNVSSPNPVRNAELTEVLGEVLNRPTLVPAPGFALRMVFGQMADDVLLTGTRVEPARLKEAGFEWEYPEVREVLEAELRR